LARILFLGDIVGRAARQAVITQLPDLRQQLAADFIVVNCENSAGGFGVTPAIADDLLAAGADVLTSGNHIWDKAEIAPYIANQPRLLRPANMGAGFPGSGRVVIEGAGGLRLGVINIQTNLFMAENDNAFQVLDQLLDKMRLGQEADFILVDMHGEATSEKMALGHFLDGRVTMVVGTHTHVPTADYRVLPGGTAYQTDSGMCGDYQSVIGMTTEAAIARFVGQPASRLSVASGPPTLCGLIAEADPASGLAVAVQALRHGGSLSQTGV
jgi:metallophosphoesterase (TIGR00282 family)